MKKIFFTLSFLLITSHVAHAGTYNYKCTAYNIDNNSGEISKLVIDRNAASLNGSAMRANDPNADIDRDILTYNGQNKLNIEVQVKKVSSITSLRGSIGSREQDVEMDKVELLTKISGMTKVFNGVCSVVQITSCGGETPCKSSEKWQEEP